jgi:hypothetical protein
MHVATLPNPIVAPAFICDLPVELYHNSVQPYISKPSPRHKEAVSVEGDAYGGSVEAT